MPKTYETWEVMKMLTENPKLKFTANSGLEYTMGVDEGYFYFKVFDNNGEYVNPDKYAGERFNGNIEVDSVWTLMQEPVPFMEAVKAYKEGKTIWCECKNSPTRYYKQSKFDARGRFIIFTDHVLEGKWFIEEPGE